MKLTIENLPQLSAQDKIDLGKIWQDSEYQMALTAPITTEHTLFVARFNGRLLAACRIKYRAKTALISDFMVREVTRRRGVGHYLLTQCLEKNPTITHWQALLKKGQINDPVAQAFLAHHHFATSLQADTYDYFCADKA